MDLFIEFYISPFNINGYSKTVLLLIMWKLQYRVKHKTQPILAVMINNSHSAV